MYQNKGTNNMLYSTAYFDEEWNIKYIQRELKARVEYIFLFHEVIAE